MKTFFAAAFVSVCVVSCAGANKTSTVDIEQMKSNLIQADKDFSRMSVEIGMKAAFVFFAADDVVQLREGLHPVVGKEALKASMLDKAKQQFTLEWSPVRADIASSGDLGYTTGNWIIRSKTATGQDTATYGNYVTIWRAQPGGGWKFVLDGGNSTPPPPTR